MALNVNKQVATIVMDTLCCIQYCIYDATHMQLYATNPHVRFSCTSNVVNEMPMWFSSICRQMMYVNTFYNLFMIILQLI
jgi:hypothetical protein